MAPAKEESVSVLEAMGKSGQDRGDELAADAQRDTGKRCTYLQRGPLTPFVVYRLAVAVLVLALIVSGARPATLPG